MHEHELQFHIQCGQGDECRCSVPAGDPGRCEKIAAYFDNPVKVQSNREYPTYTGTLLGEKVSVCSTGIGGPSAVIAMEELHKIAPTLSPGGHLRRHQPEGQERRRGHRHRRHPPRGGQPEYAPIEFPAVSDYEVQEALVAAAKDLGKPWHAGVVQCKDSFYGQHDPSRMPVSYELLHKWEAWKRLGVLASEMESAALFCCAAALGVRCGSCFHVIWNQERELAGLDQAESHDLSAAIEVGIEARTHPGRPGQAGMIPHVPFYRCRAGISVRCGSGF